MNNKNEIESKILEVNHNDLEHKIFALWWKKVFDWILEGIWLENINWKKVRVRKEGTETITEYKEKIINASLAKEAEETWYKASDFENQIKVFEKLWFKQISRSVKIRVSYLINIDNEDIKLDFDDYSDLDWMKIPELLEIEAYSYETILKVAIILWFSKEDLKSWDARKLLEYYKNKL